MAKIIEITTKSLTPLPDRPLSKDQIEVPKRRFTTRILQFMKNVKPSPTPIVAGRILPFPKREHLIDGVTVYRPGWAEEAVSEGQ